MNVVKWTSINFFLLSLIPPGAKLSHTSLDTLPLNSLCRFRMMFSEWCLVAEPFQKDTKE